MELDIEALLASGAMEGPGKRTRPITLSPLQRFLRWLKGTV